MTCRHCQHDIFEHLDRAVVPCALELATNFSAETGKRHPRAKRCPCPGFEADLAQG